MGVQQAHTSVHTGRTRLRARIPRVSVWRVADSFLSVGRSSYISCAMATFPDLLETLDQQPQVRGRQFERICQWYLREALADNRGRWPLSDLEK
jgi:hypothetical protein